MHLPTRYFNLSILVRLFINEMDLLDRMDRTEVRKGHPQPCLNNDNCINLLGVSSALARPALCRESNSFDMDRKNCRPCRVGTFQDQGGQTQCKICPVISGRPGTTYASGARSATNGKEHCPAGKFLQRRDGHYQPAEGSFACRSSQAGWTARTDQAISSGECSGKCPTGVQLTSLFQQRHL